MVNKTAYPSTGNECSKLSKNAPPTAARCAVTACAKGKRLAIFSNQPPTNDKSNHTPESQAERLVNNAPQIPPTCLTVNTLPHNSPKAIYNTETGNTITSAYTIFTLMGKPSANATK